MIEKFTQLFSLEKNLYSEDVPVIIKEGVLLKDNDKNKLIIQLQMLNICKQVIKAVKLKIIGYDTFEQQVCEQGFQYIDMTVQPNDDFGGNIILVIENQAIRSFAVEFVQILFDDKTNWYGKKEKFIHIPDDVTVEEYLRNEKFKVKMKKYDEALDLYSFDNIEHILEAKTIFEKLENFEDSDKYITACEDKIKIIEKQNYFEKEKLRNKQRRMLIIGIPIIVICVLIILFLLTSIIGYFVAPLFEKIY